MKAFYLFACLLIAKTSIAQTDDLPNVRFAKTITAEDLKRHLYVIASDSLQGRETGTEGEKKAANYIAQHFKNCGLLENENAPGYIYPFTIFNDSVASCTFSFDEKTFDLWKDFYAPINVNETSSVTAAELVFVGYGISDSLFDEYAKIDVKNKIVLVFEGEPMHKKKYLTTETGQASDWSKGISKKINAARNHGAMGIIIINPEQKEMDSDFVRSNQKSRVYLKKESSTQSTVPAIITNSATARIILGEKKFESLIKIYKKNKPFKSYSIRATCSINYSEMQVKRQSQNVVGYIEGSDLKNEFVILTAHYDHLGMHDGEIYYGADDDGSGTVTVMEMAEAFAKAKAENYGPRRSIVFMTVSGEEKGLLGSKYYTEHPAFPLESTLVNLNSDMIGRWDSAHASDTNYVYLVGADRMSTELNAISERINSTYTKFNIDYKYNDKNDPQRIYKRSDHYNFVKKGIPIIFYFDGLHQDYHQPSDTPEKISYTLLAKRAQLVFYTAWELANLNGKLILDKSNEEQ